MGACGEEGEEHMFRKKGGLIWLSLVSSLLGMHPSFAQGFSAESEWERLGDMTDRRAFHGLIALADGSVLAVGGAMASNPLRTAERLRLEGCEDTCAWRSVGSMAVTRVRLKGVLLPDGRVLVSGGGGLGANRTAELFDPESEEWRVTGSMSRGRVAHTLTLLPNGRVLAIGGHIGPTPTTELYDPETELWTDAADMAVGRALHTATLLADGRVLVVGGTLDRRAEIYDPDTGVWSGAGVTNAIHRGDATATLLNNGQVLVVGGFVADTRTEIFDPEEGTWTEVSRTLDARKTHIATLLPDSNRVLVAGGYVEAPGRTEQIRSAEVYDPTSDSWTQIVAMSTGRSVGAGVLLGQRFLVAGGIYVLDCDNESDCFPSMTTATEILNLEELNLPQ